MNSFSVITKFLPQAVDKVFMAESKTAVLENGSKFIDVNFTEAGYIKIAEILMDGLSDYYQVNQSTAVGTDYAHYAGHNAMGARDGFRVGSSAVNWKIHQLQWKRGKQFQVDYIADEEMAGVVIANLLNEFNRTKVVPEVDACRFSVMASKCSTSLGNLKSEAPTVANIISGFNSAYEWLAEHEVPAEDQVIFVSPKIMTLIRGSSELTRFLTQADYKNGNGIEFSLKAYEGRPIIEVPSNRFLDSILVGDNGYTAASGSHALNYMIVSKRAVVPLRKLEYSKVFSPEVVQDYYGYKIDYLLYHGIVVPKNKIPGIYCSVSSSTTGASVSGVLSVLLKTGTGATGSVLFEEAFSQPAGLLGTICYQKSTSEITTGLKKVGDSVTIDGTNIVKLEPGDNFSPSTSVHCQFILVQNDKAIAVSGDIDVTSYKKA